MKKILLAACLGICISSAAQLQVFVQLPPGGLKLKDQLWNMLVVNPSTTTRKYHVELRLGDSRTNQPIMSASTGVFDLPAGNQPLQVNHFRPIQYNILQPSYAGFLGSSFLPIGNFLVCYSFYEHNNDRVEKVAEECTPLLIEPLSPPQLVLPSDQSGIETNTPIFNWLAPSPLNLFAQLTYAIDIVEMLPNQSASDAIRLNIPLHHAVSIPSLQYPYPLSAPALVAGKRYAWRVLAMNDGNAVASSESWWFFLSVSARNTTVHISDLPYAKLHKEEQGGYAVMADALRIDYYNETSDTVWVTKLYDLSANRAAIVSPFDTLKMRRGSNQVKIDLRNAAGLIDQHLYLLELQNSRNETWRLRFEYRRRED